MNFLLVLVFGADLHDDRRHADRPADAAPARRLHRDRDAGVRRDHRQGRGQRRRAQAVRLPDHRRRARERVRSRPDHHRRPPGHHAGRQGRPAGHGAVQVARAAAVVLAGARDGRRRAVRQLPPARLAARPRVGRAARGRDRRRLDGRPGRQDEAAGLRHGRRVRRLRRRLPRVQEQHGQRRPVPVLLLDLHPRHGDPRRPRVDLGHRARARSRSRSSTSSCCRR